MPDTCVAASCSNVADPSKGIFVHTIPFFGDSRPEAIKRRKKWVELVKGFLCLKVKLKRFKAINFRLNPADCTRVSKAKKLPSPADVISTLGLRPPFTRP